MGASNCRACASTTTIARDATRARSASRVLARTRPGVCHRARVTGHLFVIQGDLTKLDTDAVVIPCDEAGNVNDVWSEVLPSGRLTRFSAGLQRYTAWSDNGVHASLGTVLDRHVELVATAAPHRALDLDELVRRVVLAVERAAATSTSHRQRKLPLVGLPLVGTGLGGLHDQRGRVVRRLVPELIELAWGKEVDVALVLNDRRDYAAVQAARAELGSSAMPWRNLTEQQRGRADDLGTRAAAGQLSLFVGSGAGVPLKLPNWRELLQAMAKRTRDGYAVPEDADLLDEAAGFKWLMGDEYFPFLQEIFDLDRHALGHSLLAALNVRRMVTTNYDPCLELALDGIHGRSYEVMTRSLASGGLPWLLKLHGDIRQPETIVLTRAEYDHLIRERSALHGVVESLLLTSHVLFVGYSLVDHDFGLVADGVKVVRDSAETGSRRPPAGTALALHPGAVDEDKWRGEVEVLTLGESHDVAGAARTLEIFLDRLAWASLQTGELSGEYLLDSRFEAGSSPADHALRGALEGLAAAKGSVAEESPTWPRVHHFLASLGLDEPHRPLADEPEPRRAKTRYRASSARELALEVARCPLIRGAVPDPAHPCHEVVTVQTGPEAERQVPEAWAGALETSRVLFISSNPSISEPDDPASPETAEAYPNASASDEEIVDFVMRRFDPEVQTRPHVLHDRHRRKDGTYAPTTRFWSAIRARAVELLGPGAEPFRDYAMTEVVHCKSRDERGVAQASSTCADRYLERIVELSTAQIVVVVGKKAHDQLAARLDLPEPPYLLERELGSRVRTVVYLPHPNAFQPKTFAGVHPDHLEALRATARGSAVTSPGSGSASGGRGEARTRSRRGNR